MRDTFWIDAEITAMRDAVPIRFAHHKNIDRPENHVLHINNYVEIYIYVSGNHKYIVENSLYDLKRGDIVIINPRDVHKALPLSVGMYERFYFLVDEHTFDAMYQNPLLPILNKPSDFGNLISLDEKARNEILDMLAEISNCFSDGKNGQLRAFSFLLRILDEINQHLSSSIVSSENTAHMPELLGKILTYVAKHTAQIHSINEIADALRLTPQYLSAYFSRHAGTTLKIYVQAKKIALAKDLLDKGADVTVACYDCGFNDCSYFIKVFKKYVGLTPLAYKQKIRT